MEQCDVAIVGGGPAGSSCAWKLRSSGLDVLVVDRALFPRDKVCAGWITPHVVDDLQLNLAEYGRGRTCQPITGFRTGVVGDAREIHTSYDRVVSFGIRRCEFDHYLLQRAGARVLSKTPISTIRREQGGWVVNDAIRARILVGAGGHFCAVARWLNGAEATGQSLVVAQEAEFPIESAAADSLVTDGRAPALYFCPDFLGYGWCFRKGHFLNVGLGRLDRRSLPKETNAFVEFLIARGLLPPRAVPAWKGHAYLVHPSPRLRIVDDGVLLVGDAAGLAYAQSGEGIRPAIESGLLAAQTITDAQGEYSRRRLAPYAERIVERFGGRTQSFPWSEMVPAGVVSGVARALLRSPRFVRHVLLDRWFLHAHEPALTFG